MKTIKILVISICAVLASVACSKRNGGGSGTATAPAVTYYLSNGVCYDAKTNQSVATTNCNTLAYYFNSNSCYATATRAVADMANCHALVGQYYINNNSCWDKTANTYTNNANCSSNGGTTTNRYVWRNNICIDTQTGWSTPNISLCSNTGGTNGDAQCLQPGRYLYVDRNGYGYPVDCRSTNCRGQMLWDQQTRTYVTCQ
jgi:hypothetical protein